MKRILAWAPHFFYAALGAAIVLMLPATVATWTRIASLVSDVPAPIVVYNQRIVWVGPRTFETHSDGASWTRSCPVIIVSRGVMLRDGTFVGIAGEVVSGPLKGTQRNPRYELRDLTPQERGPSVFRFTLPDYIDPSEVAMYQATFTVPDDRACGDGYVGVTVVRLTFPAFERR
jgi:hypothetical protein